MTMIAAANVTYTINDRVRIGNRYFVQATMAFGNASLTYTTGGIPITSAKLGFRRSINALMVVEGSKDNLTYQWDQSANTIRILTAGTEHTADTTAVAVTSLEVYVVGW
jgi:hypothetical protein